jgi:hypothetical protein
MAFLPVGDDHALSIHPDETWTLWLQARTRVNTQQRGSLGILTGTSSYLKTRAWRWHIFSKYNTEILKLEVYQTFTTEIMQIILSMSTMCCIYCKICFEHVEVCFCGALLLLSRAAGGFCWMWVLIKQKPLSWTLVVQWYPFELQ